MGNVTVNLSIGGLIISAIMLCVAIINMNRDQKNHEGDRFRESIETKTKLDMISDNMEEIKKNFQKLLEKMQSDEVRTKALETSVTILITRVENLEKRERK